MFSCVNKVTVTSDVPEQNIATQHISDNMAASQMKHITMQILELKTDVDQKNQSLLKLTDAHNSLSTAVANLTSDVAQLQCSNAELGRDVHALKLDANISAQFIIQAGKTTLRAAHTEVSS